MVCYAIVSFFLLLYKLFLGNVSFQQISNLSNAYPRRLRNLLVAQSACRQSFSHILQLFALLR